MKIEAPAVVSRDDVAALARLDADLRGAAAWSRQRFDALLADTRYRLLGVFHDDTLIAFIVCSAGPFDLEIEMLGVDRHYRRRGLAGALLEAVMDWGGRSGYERLLLEVRAGNQAARALYEGQGFALDGRRPGYYPPLKTPCPPLEARCPSSDASCQPSNAPSPGANSGEREDALLMSLALARPDAPSGGPPGDSR